jgi:hypothetical protein
MPAGVLTYVHTRGLFQPANQPASKRALKIGFVHFSYFSSALCGGKQFPESGIRKNKCRCSRENCLSDWDTRMSYGHFAQFKAGASLIWSRWDWFKFAVAREMRLFARCFWICLPSAISVCVWGKKAAASAFTAAQVLFVPATVCKTSARRRGHIERPEDHLWSWEIHFCTRQFSFCADWVNFCNRNKVHKRNLASIFTPRLNRFVSICLRKNT